MNLCDIKRTVQITHSLFFFKYVFYFARTCVILMFIKDAKVEKKHFRKV